MTDSESSPPPPTPSTPETNNRSLTGELLSANQELRASVVSNVLTKGLIGLGVGVGTSLFIFKRKLPPIMLTTGFGLGMGYSEGSQMVRDYYEDIRVKALEASRKSEKRFPPPLL